MLGFLDGAMAVAIATVVVLPPSMLMLAPAGANACWLNLGFVVLNCCVDPLLFEPGQVLVISVNAPLLLIGMDKRGTRGAPALPGLLILGLRRTAPIGTLLVLPPVLLRGGGGGTSAATPLMFRRGTRVDKAGLPKLWADSLLRRGSRPRETIAAFDDFS